MLLTTYYYQNSFPGVNFTRLNATPSAESFFEGKKKSFNISWIYTDMNIEQIDIEQE